MTDQSLTILETPRLLIRPLTMDDLDPLAELYSDPEVRTFFPEGTLTREQTREELEWMINVSYQKYGFGLWATIHKPTGAFIGRCGLLHWVLDGQTEVEVAYTLARAWWQQGLATEAARAILTYGFEQLQLSRLICLIDEGNQASIKVATNIGMSFEKIVDDGLGPARLYARMRQPA